ncbi:DUF3857 domain-containing protein [Algibacter amylolyticus]|uniref:DUF3857 domain-containing protein n=1 Tax=Algibacter amylolyticus TaxID=1608400 RepID=A0A5M7BC63_9FLAO|nr:DUF3857 domain-containing protein [Algibacter amylolyticus]KAA5825757.1 DUF3857 domain-containing protein [Algibacter amylolyticus]MBB5268008.1 transglutaminase-like putative cysteine protease [Algibacter amylolyticus]TSJ80055.1 DUF3857 domain-containing protein [Algibacter amylolyticus]
MRSFFIAILVITISTTKLFSQVLKEKTPNWVDTNTYTEDVMHIDDVSDGSFILLYDNQIHASKKIEYSRLVMKITDNVGIQNASTVSVSYDPAYQSLKFHSINVIRDNKIIDKLDLSNFQVMRRELNTEIYLYDGSLSAVMNISDVRTGDIIDYSYSIYGFNPLSKKYSQSFYLNDIDPIGKINVSILSNNKLNHKTFNTSPVLNLTKVNNLNKYHWVVSNTTKLDYEENIPSWKFIYNTLFVSEYNSWAEVVDWGIKLYEVNTKIDNKLQLKINEINNAFTSKGEKIKATLDFVQNDVRYLGFEFGIGGYKPFTPNLVFERRFGDCKDKSLLMITMLKEMGIEAYPMLVNTTLKHSIKELLPSPKFFDHCVVKVVDNKSKYYYDPTITNQGGDYDSTHFPDYRFGLVLQKGNTEFDEIKPKSENKVEVLEEFTIDTIGKGAILKVVSTYYESEADNMRNYFKNNGKNAIKKEYENFYSNYYFNVSSPNAPTFKDRKISNIFKVFETYKIDSIWEPMVEKENHIAASFTATNLLNSLYIPNKQKRTSEIAITYPIIREHKIKVNLPTAWDITNNKLFVNSPGFYYEWKVNYDRSQKAINLYYYLETQKDHITKGEFKQYLNDVKKVDQSSGYLLFIPKNFSSSSILFDGNTNNFSGIFDIIKLILILGFIVVIGLLVFMYFQNKKR